MVIRHTVLVIGLALVAIFWSCRASAIQFLTPKQSVFDHTITDIRDQEQYGIVTVGEQIWFAENLRFKSSSSICYKNKTPYCTRLGRLYPASELDSACPPGWRVPKVDDWNQLKAYFLNDSIHALLDTIGWVSSNKHSNASGLSIQGSGYQMKKRLFIGNGTASTLWLNQRNKYDEYYHTHLYGGKGIYFEQSNFTTNEVFHAHPIEDLANRRFSIRCLCDKSS